MNPMNFEVGQPFPLPIQADGECFSAEQDLDILRNVLYSGVWQRYTLLNEKKLKQRKEDAHAE